MIKDASFPRGKMGVTTPLWAMPLALVLMGPAPAARAGAPGNPATSTTQAAPLIQVPPGFRIEKVVDGLSYPTAITWDDQGRMYVTEAGGQFLEEPPPARLLRIDPTARTADRVTEMVNLTNKGILEPVVGITWSKGNFYITHRAADRTGAVSQVTPTGAVSLLFSGIIDSQSEHGANDIRVGPDGQMYVCVGPAFNSAVAGIDVGPFIDRSPMVHPTVAQDVILTGQNFETPDFRTPDESDKVQTGAFVPFGTPTTPGQRIKGTNKAGGTILVFDPANAEATVHPYAWGFRNVIGMVWNAQGEMFAAVNSYDVRGSRPINDDAEATYRVRQGAWYGWPDYTAALDPVTDAKYDSPDPLKAPVFVNGQPQGKKIGFLIDHAASGLRAPDKSLIYGLHEIGSSPSKLDVAPASWGPLAGQVFVAEWGDLAPGTSPLRIKASGYQVVRINTTTGRAEPFIHNTTPLPASEQGAPGQGLERPFDVRFGPDGAMYIVDYGQARVNFARIKLGQVPYEFPPQTGAIWKVTRQ